ncbi:hypothetical protein [Seleniivibrio woodruffii]|uniref:hypothetical protein n=1 Tax=Seleniivibrio woodruffii TaxID=1078050 RepID=UPI0026EF10D8|nr:hypothetical protein [Seleniivibrio woodruffii]
MIIIIYLEKREAEMDADALILISLVLSAVIYITYYLFVRQCSCGGDNDEPKDKQSIEHICCGKCHEHSESQKTFY